MRATELLTSALAAVAMGLAVLVAGLGIGEAVAPVGSPSVGPTPGDSTPDDFAPNDSAPGVIASSSFGWGAGVTDAAALPPLAESRTPSAGPSDETTDGALQADAIDQRFLPQVAWAASSLDEFHVFGPTPSFLCVYRC